jgi:hypothetical protein
LVSLPALCALASAQHFSKDACNLSAGAPDFFISFSFFWLNLGRPADAAAAGASGLYCSSLFLERVRRTSAHFSQSSMRVKTLRYLNYWPSESSPYMSNARRICTKKPASSQIGDPMSTEESE